MAKKCNVPGCDKKQEKPCRGLCWTHYGDPKVREKHADAPKIRSGKKTRKVAKKRKATPAPMARAASRSKLVPDEFIEEMNQRMQEIIDDRVERKVREVLGELKESLE